MGMNRARLALVAALVAAAASGLLHGQAPATGNPRKPARGSTHRRHLESEEPPRRPKSPPGTMT